MTSVGMSKPLSYEWLIVCLPSIVTLIPKLCFPRLACPNTLFTGGVIAAQPCIPRSLSRWSEEVTTKIRTRTSYHVKSDL